MIISVPENKVQLMALGVSDLYNNITFPETAANKPIVTGEEASLVEVKHSVKIKRHDMCTIHTRRPTTSLFNIWSW